MMFLIRVDQNTNLFTAGHTTLPVDRGTELLASTPQVVRGFVGRQWQVPLNGQTYCLDVDAATKVRPSNLTVPIADEENTCLFTCHWCGEWLKQGDEGYGTRHGWCGCEEQT